MKITAIHSRGSKGSTFSIARLLLDELEKKGAEVTEFSVQSASPCIGCFRCFTKDEKQCPHRLENVPIIESIESADIVLIDSPCYGMGMSGQLKCFLDHLCYRWMSHRPHPLMFSKIAVAISTAAGMGAGKVTKDIALHFFYLGIPFTFRLAFSIQAMSWDEVSATKKEHIRRKVDKTARNIIAKSGKIKPGLKSRFMFAMMRLMQKRNTWNPVDKSHWEANGWV
ncbi:MAG: flavodoxin family protein [Chitinispirillaceae bacterium]|nr:flavodoxin family protein [Chitinispirillaceae bacterium]